MAARPRARMMPIGPPALREVRSPSTWRSHEADGVATIPKMFFHESFNPEKWTGRSIREAVCLSNQLGSKYPSSIHELRQENGLMTLQGRLMTFPEDWSDRSRVEMALIGLYMSENGKVRCYGCGVEFRKPTSRTGGYDEIHRTLAPNCQQLKRYHCHGPQTTHEAKRIRHNSDSTINDLEVEDVQALKETDIEVETIHI